MRRITLASLAAIALAGCGSGAADADRDGTISKQEAASQIADLSLEPGMWEQSIQYTELSLPNSPPDVQQAMKATLGKPLTGKHCLTPEQAKQPAPDFFSGEGQSNCTYEQFDRSGGRLNLRMTCASAQGGKVAMAMSGQYASTSYDVTFNGDVTGSSSGDIKMKGTISARRIGNCPA